VLALGDIWLEYRTAGDTRVRPEHAALEGVVFKAGSSEAANIYPPNSYQCRCVMVARETRPEGARDARDININDVVTDGFRGAPGAQIETEAA